ncbi:hypothetical protein [Parafrankia sp. BMG5.11]|uniref:hypothetical protein n=1 Tax=Parafrankia sp. BMG5.11 TaxID=222540 RepID=UPI00103E10BF|nr:hypothetical protein [Parafrankia sp. BMG5.11]TCJ40712.1 hypothetical protein E0504_03800 [Parafrankia sp. BMG5.11]
MTDTDGQGAAEERPTGAAWWGAMARAFQPSPYGERCWGDSYIGCFIKSDDDGGTLLTSIMKGVPHTDHIVGVPPGAFSVPGDYPMEP